MAVTFNTQLHLLGAEVMTASSSTALQRPSTHKHRACLPLPSSMACTVALPHANRLSWLNTTEPTCCELSHGSSTSHTGEAAEAVDVAGGALAEAAGTGALADGSGALAPAKDRSRLAAGSGEYCGAPVVHGRRGVE
jgi:hypothetical protein